MSTISELFGTMVFNDDVMKERLPEDVYNSIQNTIKNGKHLDLTSANIVPKSSEIVLIDFSFKKHSY